MLAGTETNTPTQKCPQDEERRYVKNFAFEKQTHI